MMKKILGFCLIFLILSARGETANVYPLFSPLNSAKSLAYPPISPPLLYTKGVIVLDPGHGGSDVGTQSLTKPRYQEKNLNLLTARFVKQYLQKMGYKIFLTRHQDVFVSLEKRSALANKYHAQLFVSLHYNSAPSAEAKGVEIFYYSSRQQFKRTQQSRAFAHSVLKSLIKQAKVTSRGVKSGNWAVIREAKMPAILIECGFMTNQEEMQKIKDLNYVRRLAWAIAQGTDAYAQQFP